MIYENSKSYFGLLKIVKNLLKDLYIILDIDM